jgi:hypothetical protein
MDTLGMAAYQQSWPQQNNNPGRVKSMPNGEFPTDLVFVLSVVRANEIWDVLRKRAICKGLALLTNVNLIHFDGCFHGDGKISFLAMFITFRNKIWSIQKLCVTSLSKKWKWYKLKTKLLTKTNKT